jgi:hypothetical protein
VSSQWRSPDQKGKQSWLKLRPSPRESQEDLKGHLGKGNCGLFFHFTGP